jgi:hypothetical protein
VSFALKPQAIAAQRTVSKGEEQMKLILKFISLAVLIGLASAQSTFAAGVPKE